MEGHSSGKSLETSKLTQEHPLDDPSSSDEELPEQSWSKSTSWDPLPGPSCKPLPRLSSEALEKQKCQSSSSPLPASPSSPLSPKKKQLRSRRRTRKRSTTSSSSPAREPLTVARKTFQTLRRRRERTIGDTTYENIMKHLETVKTDPEASHYVDEDDLVHCDKVINRLYVGCEVTALSLEYLKRRKIVNLIHLSSHYGFADEFNFKDFAAHGISFTVIDATNTDDMRLSLYFKYFINHLYRCLEMRQRTLVFDVTGRGAAIIYVAAFLMEIYNYSAVEALSVIKQVHDGVPREMFIRELITFESHLLREEQFNLKLNKMLEENKQQQEKRLREMKAREKEREQQPEKEEEDRTEDEEDTDPEIKKSRQE